MENYVQYTLGIGVIIYKLLLHRFCTLIKSVMNNNY